MGTKSLILYPIVMWLLADWKEGFPGCLKGVFQKKASMFAAVVDVFMGTEPSYHVLVLFIFQHHNAAGLSPQGCCHQAFGSLIKMGCGVHLSVRPCVCVSCSSAVCD